jgi:hypothetical protein
MAETNAHTEVPAGGKVMFPPFQKETFPSQLFWLAITFIALYVVMARIALPQIGAIFQARRDRISGDLAEVERGLALGFGRLDQHGAVHDQRKYTPSRSAGHAYVVYSTDPSSMMQGAT